MPVNPWAAALAGALCLAGPLLPPTASVSGRSFPDDSDHWAGYVAYQGPYRQVSATWAQPAATTPSAGPCRHGALTLWAGLGGYSSGSLAQAGTSFGTPGVGNGQAWWELSPAAMMPVPLYVRPGHKVSVQVSYAGGGRFDFTIKDLTTGASWSHREGSSAPPDLSTAEVIAERPCLAHCGAPSAAYAPLARFKQVTFAAARADGRPLGDVSSYQEQMYTQALPTGSPLAAPSPFSASGTGFSVRQSGCS